MYVASCIVDIDRERIGTTHGEIVCVFSFLLSVERHRRLGCSLD